MSNGSTGQSKWRVANSQGVAFPVTTTGTTQAVFEDVSEANLMNASGMRERLIINNGTGPLTIGVLGQTPVVANASGTFTVPAGGDYSTEASNALTILGAAGQPVTCLER